MTNFVNTPKQKSAIHNLATFMATGEAEFTNEDLTFLIPYVISSLFAQGNKSVVEASLGHPKSADGPAGEIHDLSATLGEIMTKDHKSGLKIFSHLCSVFSKAEVKESASSGKLSSFLYEHLLAASTEE
jgi:hypothetical protein